MVCVSCTLPLEQLQCVLPVSSPLSPSSCLSFFLFSLSSPSSSLLLLSLSFLAFGIHFYHCMHPRHLLPCQRHNPVCQLVSAFLQFVVYTHLHLPNIILCLYVCVCVWVYDSSVRKCFCLYV